uniref:N/A n=1 Tax=Ganoderma boninense TaxID=34458 RepID=A0A5K1JZ98_9APHY|nr:N/A [Ganoderma boninense]
MAASASTQAGSKRWTYFHSALQLAIQRSAHKWTYEDFAECFSLWCDEQPENAATIFNLVSGRLESSITENCEELFKKYNVKENLDNLHAVVTAARARKQADYDSKDVWREDLQPRAAVRARTIPLLEQERDRLRAELGLVLL